MKQGDAIAPPPTLHFNAIALPLLTTAEARILARLPTVPPKGRSQEKFRVS